MKFGVKGYLWRLLVPGQSRHPTKNVILSATTSPHLIDPRLAILDNGFGHARSRKERKPIDANGNPVPWYTYPAIEYLTQLAVQDKRVFEYGAGNSTLFWCNIAREVVTVEKTLEWYQYVDSNRTRNLELFRVHDESYPSRILRHGMFDIIVIDGSERHACAQYAVRALQSGGLIILDNSDWYVEAARYLRGAGLLQVDMSGFGPINNYTWVTSFFFSRNFAFQSRGHNQPEHVIGGLKKYAAEEEGLRTISLG